MELYKKRYDAGIVLTQIVSFNLTLAARQVDALMVDRLIKSKTEEEQAPEKKRIATTATITNTSNDDLPLVTITGV